MPSLPQNKKRDITFNDILKAAKKLSPDEKRLLELQLLRKDALKELKEFEKQLRKSKPVKKIKDDEIRRKNN